MIEVLEGHNLTRFLDLLEAAGMMDELSSLTDVTVFAPSNRAVEELPTEFLDELMVNMNMYFKLYSVPSAIGYNQLGRPGWTKID